MRNMYQSDESILSFVKESNAIEGIFREPTAEELKQHRIFLHLEEVKIADLIRFVNIFEPGATLRDKRGLDVFIGGRMAPPGGQSILYALENLLEFLMRKEPYKTHIDYQMLHPFTDGNGRSGRMIWAWQMHHKRINFLQGFYYQTLASNIKGLGAKWRDIKI